MAYGALQRFVWDFGQTALSSLQFLKEIFVDTPILRIEAIPQHWELCSLLSWISVLIIQRPPSVSAEEMQEKGPTVFSSSSEKTKMYNHLQISEQR